MIALFYVGQPKFAVCAQVTGNSSIAELIEAETELSTGG